MHEQATPLMTRFSYVVDGTGLYVRVAGTIVHAVHSIWPSQSRVLSVLLHLGLVILQPRLSSTTQLCGSFRSVQRVLTGGAVQEP